MSTPCMVHGSVTLMSTWTQRFSANRTSSGTLLSCGSGTREGEGECGIGLSQGSK